MDMSKRVEALFTPDLTLYWRGKFGNRPNGYYADRLQDERLLRQFMQQAGLDSGRPLAIQDYDKVLAVAGTYGMFIETIGGPD